MDFWRIHFIYRRGLQLRHLNPKVLSAESFDTCSHGILSLGEVFETESAKQLRLIQTNGAERTEKDETVDDVIKEVIIINLVGYPRDFFFAKLGQMLTKLWDTSFWYVDICLLKIDTKCCTFF